MSTQTSQNYSKTLSITNYLKHTHDPSGNPRFLINMPWQLIKTKKLRDEAPERLKVLKNPIFIYDAQNGTTKTCCNIIIWSYDITGTIENLNNYINKSNQSNQTD